MISINYPEGKPHSFRSGGPDYLGDPMTMISLPGLEIATAVHFADCPHLLVDAASDIPLDYPHRDEILHEISMAQENQ